MNYAELKETQFTVGQGQPSTHTNINYEDDTPRELPPFYYNGAFKQGALVDEIMDRYWVLTVENTIYVYDPIKGYYGSDGAEFIKSFCEKALKQHFRRKHAEEVIYQIRAKTFRKPTEPPLNLLNVKNGILDIETGELDPHSPTHFFTSTLNVIYDPATDCPMIKRFLGQVTSKEDDRLTLQEYAGYTLLRNYIYQKALLLVGDGANGKSTFLNLIKIMLGYDNLSGLSLQQLSSNRFALARLYKKMANIYPDLTASALRETGPFKMATGGDPLEAEIKFYQRTIKFTNYAKLIFSANTIPQVSEEDSDAFFRRWILITFPYKFEGANADKNLLDKLTSPAEMLGFLNWALEGLKRLQDSADFTYRLTTDQIREQYQRMASTIFAFLEDCTEYDAQGWIPKDYLYTRYIQYCIDNGLPRKSKNTLSKELPMHRPAVIPKRERIEGLYTHGWHGIRLLPEEEQPPQPTEHQTTLPARI